MKELNNNESLLSNKSSEKPSLLKPEIKYELKDPPTWYVQGSYVLDQIFKKDFSRDIDIFLPSDSVPVPSFKEDKFNHIIDSLPENFYFPPKLGFYNTDKYLLTAQGIIRPIGFPEKPKNLELLEPDIIGVVEVIKGIKTLLRYNLIPTEETKKIWRETFEQEFDPCWMKEMFFDSETEVKKYITDNVEDETSGTERNKVLHEIEKIIGRKLI